MKMKGLPPPRNFVLRTFGELPLVFSTKVKLGVICYDR